jgi:hypothetical protein
MTRLFPDMHGRRLLLAILLLAVCSSSVARAPVCQKPQRSDRRQLFKRFGMQKLLDACLHSPPGEGVTCRCEHVAGRKYLANLECTYNTPSALPSNWDILRKMFCDENCFCPRSWKQAVREMMPGRRNTKVYQPFIDIDGASPNSCATDCTSYASCDGARGQAECVGVVCELDQQTAPGPWLGMGSCVSLNGRKRDVGGPVCPCNGTFASRDCCWEESGIVHDGLGLATLEESIEMSSEGFDLVGIHQQRLDLIESHLPRLTSKSSFEFPH